MITTLTGNNHFGLQAALHRRLEDFVAEHGDIALETVDGEEADYQRIVEAIQNLPFLASRKLIVLRNPGSNKQFADRFSELLATIPENNDLLIYEPKLDKRTAYAKSLKQHTNYQVYDELDARQLPQWLSEQAKERGGQLSQADAGYLVSRLGTNQMMLSNELDKLLAYQPRIDRTAIDQLTEPTPQSTIFQLLEAAFAGDRQRTLAIYQDQRAQRVEPQAILPMLAWQLQILAIIKTAGRRSSDEVAKQAGLNPYVVRKSQGLAAGLTLARLKQLIGRLRQLDVQLKTTSVDADEAVLSFLIDLTEGR